MTIFRIQYVDELPNGNTFRDVEADDIDYVVGGVEFYTIIDDDARYLTTMVPYANVAAVEVLYNAPAPALSPQEFLDRVLDTGPYAHEEYEGVHATEPEPEPEAVPASLQDALSASLKPIPARAAPGTAASPVLPAIEVREEARPSMPRRFRGGPPRKAPSELVRIAFEEDTAAGADPGVDVPAPPIRTIPRPSAAPKKSVFGR